jgi:hypothetical protein
VEEELLRCVASVFQIKSVRLSGFVITGKIIF